MSSLFDKDQTILSDQAILSEGALDKQVAGDALNSRILEVFESDAIKVRSSELNIAISPSSIEHINRLLAEIIYYHKQNLLYSDEIDEIRRYLHECNDAVRAAEEATEKGGSLKAAANSAGISVGVLFADDVTGIGVADDVLIPFVLVAAGGLALAYLIAKESPKNISEKYKEATSAVSLAITTVEQVLISLRNGDKVRSLTKQIMKHLARILGSSVGGEPPDHQQDPEKDRKHWWTEIVTFINNIRKLGMTEKELLRELQRKYSQLQIEEIKQALRRAAELLKQDPPNFPPIT